MQDHQMLRPTEVMARTGLSRTTIWRKVKDGSFPNPLVLGKNSIGWPAQTITDWLESRERRSYSAESSAQAEAAA